MPHLQDVNLTYDDLPDWMRHALRPLDWGFVIVLVLSSLAMWHFVETDTLNAFNDSPMWVYRTLEVSESLKDGIFYPRWSAESLGGYGAPIYHFLPPLPAMLTAIVYTLFTNDANLAYEVVMAGAFIVSALWLYVFLQHRTDAFIALMSTLLFIWSPYMGRTVPYILGDLSQMLGICLIVGHLWSVDKFIRREQAFDTWHMMVILMCLMLVSPLMLFFGVLSGTLLLLTQDTTRTTWRLYSLYILFGVLATAFYWLPALVEGMRVNWLSHGDSIFIPEMSFEQFFQSSGVYDFGQFYLPARFNSGWLLITSGTIGWIIAIRQRQMFPVAMGIVAGVILVMFVLTQSSLIGAFGYLTLCLAICSTQLVMSLYRLISLWRFMGVVILIACLVAVAFPIVLPRQVSHLATPPLSALNTIYERHERVAVLPLTWRVPSYFDRLPDALAGDREPIERIGQSISLQTILLEQTRQSFVYRVNSTEEQIVTTQIGCFSGWRVTIDEQLLTTSCTDGQLQFVLPIVNGGDLSIRIMPTVWTAFSWIISLVVIVGVTIIAFQRRPLSQVYYEDSILLSRPTAAVLLALAVLVTGLRILPDVRVRLLDTFSDTQPSEGLNYIRATTPDDLQLESYGVFEHDNDVTVRFIWRSEGEASDYQRRLSLIKIEARRAMIIDDRIIPPAYDIPTSYYPDYGRLIEDFTYSIPENLEPGSYQLRLSLESCVMDEYCAAVSLLSTANQSLGESLTIYRFSVIE